MSIEARSYIASDKEKVIELLVDVFGDKSRATKLKMWDWLHERDDTAEPGQRSILLVEEGKVLGYAGASAMTLLIEGNDVPAMISHDVGTDPSNRGLGGQMIREQIRIMPASFGIATKRHWLLWERLLKKKTVVISQTYRQVLLLSIDHILKKKKLSLLTVIANPLYKLWLRSKLALVLLSQDGHKYEFKEFDAFDPSIAALWARFAIGRKFLVKHDLDWLRWRFERVPFKYHKYVLIHECVPVGYFVVRRTRVADRPILLILEAVTVPENSDAHYHAIVSYIVRTALKEKFSDIRTLQTNCTSFINALARFGFVKRKVDDMPTVGYFPRLEEKYSQAEIYNGDNWCFWMSDSDFEFGLFGQYEFGD
jgi:hypothetical protein